MSSAFSRTARGLGANSFHGSLAVVLLAVALLTGWGIWFFFAEVALYEVSEEAWLEADGADHPAIAPAAGQVRVVAGFSPAGALGRLEPGQVARLRLDGFPWTQYGSIGATVAAVDSAVRQGQVRVELEVRSIPPAIPLRPGLPGMVEVQVERVTPATLVLRAAGRLLDSRASGAGR